MEAVHRRLVIDRIDGNRRSWQHEQIDRAIAEGLIGDVDVAALRVAGSRSLRHCPRLVQVDSQIVANRESLDLDDRFGDEPVGITLIAVQSSAAGKLPRMDKGMR
jgi:hypothetical protein